MTQPPNPPPPAEGSSFLPPTAPPPQYPAPAYQQPAYQQPSYAQPSYEQSQYQQSQYQQQMGPQTTRMARIDPGPSYAFGVVGALIAVVGVAAGIVSFTALKWLGDGDASAKFSDLRKFVDAAGIGESAPGDTEMYFKWLGWALLIGAFVIALLACLPSPASAALRVLGVLAGLAGIGLTLWAIKADGSWGDVFDNAEIGLWVALGGFLLIAIGAAVGPRRARY